MGFVLVSAGIEHRVTYVYRWIRIDVGYNDRCYLVSKS